jgi:reactive chlorine resistance protein C
VVATSFRRTILVCLSDSFAVCRPRELRQQTGAIYESERYCSYGTNQKEEELAMKYSLPDVDIRKTGGIAKIEGLATVFLRYGLVVSIGWIAAMKVTEYEAKGIRPLIAHSPFLSWGYNVWSVHHFTMIIGAIEVSIAILIALRRWFPTASAAGSLGAVFMFLTTLSFIITTPGWEPTLGGFPALSGDVGEFLIKDLVLLGAALWTLADALSAVSPKPNFLRNHE